MQSIIDWLTTNWSFIPMIIGAASAAAAVLPAPKEGTVWATVRAVIDWLALNVGNAKNAPKP